MKVIFAALVFAGLALVDVGGRTDRAIGGKLPSDVFSDPSLAALAAAACDGNIPGVQEQLAKGADANGRGLDGATPLFWALACENPAGVRTLLQAGADPNAQLDGRQSLTYRTAATSQPELLQLLLEHGGDPSATSPQSLQPALTLAFTVGVETGNWRNWHLLLDAGADVNRPIYPGTDMTIAVWVMGSRRYEQVLDILRSGYSHNLQFLERMLLEDLANARRQSDIDNIQQALEMISERQLS